MPTLPATRDCMEQCWEILPKVSRSFALVTRNLKEDPRSGLGDAVMVFYLVCRVLDTVEDSALPGEEKGPLYGAFLAMLGGGADVELAARIAPAHAGYRELLASAGHVRDALVRLDAPTREIVLRRAREMAAGMDAFGTRRIVTVADLDAYCHPVAVVVGHGLTELFALHGHMPPPTERTYALSRHFGLCLQKVNVTRDFGQDLAAGRAYWPEEILVACGLTARSAAAQRGSPATLRALAAMVDAIAPDARGAIDYTLLIPPRERHLRMFCAVTLLLALRTLALVRGNPDVFAPSLSPHPRGSLKVPRAEVAALVSALHDAVGDDGRLAALFGEAHAAAYPPGR